MEDSSKGGNTSMAVTEELWEHALSQDTRPSLVAIRVWAHFMHHSLTCHLLSRSKPISLAVFIDFSVSFSVWDRTHGFTDARHILCHGVQTDSQFVHSMSFLFQALMQHLAPWHSNRLCGQFTQPILTLKMSLEDEGNTAELFLWDFSLT